MGSFDFSQNFEIPAVDFDQGGDFGSGSRLEDQGLSVAGEIKGVEAEIKEEDEVLQKLSEELSAFESYMKFYQIPYLDGEVELQTESNPVQENEIGQLWSFDDVPPPDMADWPIAIY